MGMLAGIELVGQMKLVQNLKLGAVIEGCIHISTLKIRLMSVFPGTFAGVILVWWWQLQYALNKVIVMQSKHLNGILYQPLWWLWLTWYLMVPVSNVSLRLLQPAALSISQLLIFNSVKVWMFATYSSRDLETVLSLYIVSSISSAGACQPSRQGLEKGLHWLETTLCGPPCQKHHRHAMS